MNFITQFIRERDERLSILARSWILLDRIQWFCLGAFIGGGIVALALRAAS